MVKIKCDLREIPPLNEFQLLKIRGFDMEYFREFYSVAKKEHEIISKRKYRIRPVHSENHFFLDPKPILLGIKKARVLQHPETGEYKLRTYTAEQTTTTTITEHEAIHFFLPLISFAELKK